MNQKYLEEPNESLGAFVPLFERLIDEDLEQAAECPVKKFYSFEELKQSIKRELLNILGTQCKFKEEGYRQLTTNSLNYGLPGMFGVPELTMYDGTNTNHWRIFARYMAKVIGVFEPRLTNITVTLNGVDRAKQFLEVVIFAHISLGIFREEATFSLRLLKRKR